MLVIAVSIALFAAPLPSQCAVSLQPGPGLTGVSGVVNASTRWDPDGPGPAPELVVVGGAFELAGSVAASRVAAFDPTTGEWMALGDGVGGEVFCLCVDAAGDLIVGGNFTTAGGAPANYIAKWNGVAWSSLGGGVSQKVYALLPQANGNVIVGGIFLTAGLIPVNRVARWDGLAWSPIGGGIPGTTGTVSTLAELPNGDILAGGHFSITVGSTAHLARFDGASWSVFANPNDGVRAMTWMPNGDLIVTGYFTQIGGVAANQVARWDGSAWAPLGSGLGNGLLQTFGSSLAVRPNGMLVIGGSFQVAGGSPAIGVVGWDGSNYVALGNNLTAMFVNTVTALSSGELFCGGTSSSFSSDYIYQWDGTLWQATTLTLGGVSYSQLFAAAELPTGEVVVGGRFTMTPDGLASYIAQWDGQDWSAMGSGMNAPVNSLAVSLTGDVVAGGDFTTAGGQPASRIAGWSGGAWTPFGSGLNGDVEAVLVAFNGDVFATGDFTLAGGVSANRIARWNGTGWSALGAGLNSSGLALAQTPSGDILVGGYFTTAGGTPANHIARWDGTQWHALGSGTNSHVLAITADPDGTVYAGGAFWQAGGIAADHIARWDGTTWTPMGVGLNDDVHALAFLPNGDLVAGGEFGLTGSTFVNSVARWSGTDWQPVAHGLLGSVADLVVHDGEELIAVGAFTRSSYQAPTVTVSRYFARFVSSCPATAVSVPTGCVGPAGAMQLTTPQLPWTGGSYQAWAAGFAPNSVAVHVLGLAPLSLPLAAAHPSGLPGCFLDMTPDVTLLSVPSSGTVVLDLPIPNSPAFGGAVLRHQVVQIELGAQLALQSLSSSNSFVLEIGSF